MTREELAEHPRVRQLMNASRLSADLLDGFGARCVHQLRFEQDWFGAMLQLLSLDGREVPPLPRVHESVSDAVVEEQRLRNAIREEGGAKTGE